MLEDENKMIIHKLDVSASVWQFHNFPIMPENKFKIINVIKLPNTAEVSSRYLRRDQRVMCPKFRHPVQSSDIYLSS